MFTRSFPAGAIALCALIAPAAAQQPVTLSGRVLEFGTSSAIVGANVVVPGVGRVLTGNNGQFRIPGVPAGRHLLTFSALGYQTEQVALTLSADTTLLVELDLQPVRVDSLIVRTRTINVRGHVLDRVTGQAVVDGDIDVGGLRRAQTSLSGGFRVARVPAGAQLVVTVRALGYEPAAIPIAAERDTTLRILLEQDIVGQRMIGQQVRRLVVRFNSTGYSSDQWDRDKLLRLPGLTAWDVLERRFGSRWAPLCVFIDEREVQFGSEMLRSYLVDELQRIEAVKRGTMVRIYTRRFMSALMGSPEISPITIISGLGKPICK